MTSTAFSDLGLIAPLVDRLVELNYSAPTDIQAQAIPAVLAGQDLIGGANTGSGKTAAFGLPLLQQLMENKDESARAKGNTIAALVLVPTRELAAQVADNLTSYAAHLNGALKIKAVFGGVSINPQMQALSRGTDILVATPGRLLDLLGSNALSLSQVQTLVLDEADRMLSLGFEEELAKLLALLPVKKQTLLFSATFPDQVQSLTRTLLSEPAEIQVQSPDASTLVQRVFTVNKGEKTEVLAHLIKDNQWRQALVFVNAKNHCEHLAKKLLKRGINADVFHGDIAQGGRSRVLDGFKSGDIDVLIATDIAARGLDIDKLPVVINFNPPRSPADYMHRIGRSGRAGEVGLALSLIDPEDYHHFKVIEKKNKIRLEREQVVGFEVDEQAAQALLEATKPVAAPEGTGKKKHKKKVLDQDQVKPQVNAHIWGRRSD